MRVFHVAGDKFAELQTLPETMPASGYLWIAAARPSFEGSVAAVQAALQRLTGAPLFDLHVVDLLNKQLPSSFDYTSAYDLLVFTRLGAGALVEPAPPTEPRLRLPHAPQPHVPQIDTSPVGFAVYDRVLFSVHPSDCAVRDFFAERLETRTSAGGSDGRGQSRMPTSPADLMLRMVNYMVDSYLELRRLLTKQLDELQAQLFNGRSPPGSWHALLDSRNTLHLLEDICEDQRAAVVEWLDSLAEWPETSDEAVRREREQLRVRSRDVLEHIERVLTHVRRLESSSETAVQMHFSEQSNRTNDIMRGLTVLTAIFLPLNLVTGFFGMNFEGLPLIHSAKGFWIVFSVMLAVAVGSSYFFWRKRYLGKS
ncbi:MAG: magnesium transporter CorA family protein [Pseudomonadota bacterium]|nr:magnesium transporter CorA family protein [Pseudomonadota bacterium]